MKRKISIVLVLILGIFLSAFTKKGNEVKLPKELKDLKVVTHIPSGKLKEKEIESFYIFTNEVTNIDYREFIHWNKMNNKSNNLEELIVDSSLWNKVSIDGNRYYSNEYHKWSNYPVVNISKEAANEYCKWLSKIWNEKQNEYKVEFRLPTKEEWEYAALGGLKKLKYPGGGPETKNAQNNYVAQFKAFGLKIGPAKVGSFSPNNYGLYDLSGNVAEMVSENIVKGGNWNSLSEEITIQSEGKYEKSPYVGFRPVMVFTKK